MFAQPETWVAIAFVILMAVFAWLGVHRTVLTALDHRAQRIKAELDDARRLKEEAAKLLADYQARRASAEREAQEIVTNARAEAERVAAEAKTRMEDFSPPPNQDGGEQDRPSRSPGAGRCPRCGSGSSRCGRLDRAVAVGQGPGRGPPAGAGHC